MSVSGIRFHQPMQPARPQMAKPAGAGATSGPSALQGAQKLASSQQPKQVSNMDVLKHLFKGIQGATGGGQQKAQGPKPPPATTEASDNSLMTYSRKDMPKFRPGPASGAGGGGSAPKANPFKAVKMGK